MSRAATLSLSTAAIPSVWLKDFGWGCAYWLTFLLLLEPGNIYRAYEAGQAMDWAREAMRILTATLLGASATPVLMALVRRYPIRAGNFWRAAAFHAAVSAAVAAALIVISCVLAALFLADERPFATAVRNQMASNWPLLVYCIGTFLAGAHALRFLRSAAAEPPPPATDYLVRVAVTARGRQSVVQVEDIDWVETQGNYLALHVGAVEHLIRETSLRFEAQLDPRQFVRIHRRVLVAVDRIAEIEFLGGGDASVRLTTGADLRVSRNFRRALRDRLAA